MHWLKDADSSNASIGNPVTTRKMWGGAQDVHPKTLSRYVVVEHFSKKPTIPTIFRDMQEEIMERGTSATPLHLKIAVCRDARKRDGYKMPIE